MPKKPKLFSDAMPSLSSSLHRNIWAQRPGKKQGSAPSVMRYASFGRGASVCPPDGIRLYFLSSSSPPATSLAFSCTCSRCGTCTTCMTRVTSPCKISKPDPCMLAYRAANLLWFLAPTMPRSSPPLTLGFVASRSRRTTSLISKSFSGVLRAAPRFACSVLSMPGMRLVRTISYSMFAGLERDTYSGPFPFGLSALRRSSS
mmetsp:Transcript_16816/g.64038  ORF Transcript_16816/g.64038 Transcript_16816/m.64038 type:complete len:202 (+) Transcript_16816:157-762(+)